VAAGVYVPWQNDKRFSISGGPFLQDANDEIVLELAVAAGCDAIITHNRRHFLQASQFGIRVLSPVEFLDELGGVP
jgi:predicted nucleic acid-binding protein